jgi:hypothetical protein
MWYIQLWRTGVWCSRYVISRRCVKARASYPPSLWTRGCRLGNHLHRTEDPQKKRHGFRKGVGSISSVRRHPLISFFVLTYAISWEYLPFGPMIAALIVIVSGTLAFGCLFQAAAWFEFGPKYRPATVTNHKEVI